MKYPKLKNNNECAFPERKECNFSGKNKRCEYMKYDDSKSPFDPTRWKCTYEGKMAQITEPMQGIKKLEGGKIK